MSAIWFRRLSLGSVCMPLCEVLLLRESTPGVPRQAVTFSLLAQRESNQRERAEHEFARLCARSATSPATHLTRYGHVARLPRGTPYAGIDDATFGSVQTQSLPDQSDFTGPPENALRGQAHKFALGSLSLVTFFLSQQKESDCPSGHPRRRLAHAKNPARSAKR